MPSTKWLKDVVCKIIEKDRLPRTGGLFCLKAANGLLLKTADNKYLCPKEE